MKTVVVANPKAANGRVGRQWPKYNRAIVGFFGPAEVRLTSAPLEATTLVRRAIREGAERIVVVGGDGTVNEAVNGFFEGERCIGGDVSLAVYPAGTGGDFARSIGLSGVPLGPQLVASDDRRIDVGRATYRAHDGQSGVRYFINISSFGASGLIVDKVNKTSKRLGARPSFLWGTLKGLLAYQNQRVRLRIDDTVEEELLINTVAVANGRYFGGAMKIAPKALLDDGAFDIVVIGDIGLATFVKNSGRIYRGTHLSLPEVRSFRGRVVQADPVGTAPVLLDIDGEQPGRLPVRYEIIPGAIKVFAPWSALTASRP